MTTALKNTTPLKVADSLKTPEDWRLTSAATRVDIIQTAMNDVVQLIQQNAELSQDAPKAKRLLDQLIINAKSLDEVRRLTGATGESNDWYVRGRGKTLVIAGNNTDFLAVLGQLIAALITGNEVIFHCPVINGAAFADISAKIITVLHSMGVPTEVLIFDNNSQVEKLLQQPDLMQVAISADIQEVLAISAELAKTDGALVQVIAVTSDNDLIAMLAPDYLYRFVTERVKTVNTTAIGGNASLLELATLSP